MRVYGVKVENFVETFSFLERQPPNPVIRGHKKSAVRKRQEASEAGFAGLEDLQDWGTCDESHYYKQEGEVRNRRRRGMGHRGLTEHPRRVPTTLSVPKRRELEFPPTWL